MYYVKLNKYFYIITVIIDTSPKFYYGNLDHNVAFSALLVYSENKHKPIIIEMVLNMLYESPITSKYSQIPLHKDIELKALITFFYLNCPRNFHVKGEKHAFWEFVYIDSGKMMITAGDKTYLLKAGELVFHKPNEFHAVDAYEGIPSNIIIASFVCTNPSMEYFEHRITSLSSAERDYLYQALEHSKSVLPNIIAPKVPSEQSFGSLQMVQANLELLLVSLIRKGEGVGIHERIESYNQMEQTKQIVTEINAYLAERLNLQLTLQQVAIDMGYSVSHLNRMYHKKTNTGIISAFTHMKMEEAQRRIHEGKMNITQVAASLGYDNTAYFSRLFRQHYNMSPSMSARSFQRSNKL